MPGESHGRRSLVGYSPRGHKELDMTERIPFPMELIDTQLELKHIEESSCSPWNSPILVITKKSNKWSLLTHLRKVNASMKPMDTLQPGIPSPTPHLFLKIGTLLLLIYKIAFLTYLYTL